MAIYHLSVKTVSRAAGRSAMACAAYRACERLECAREGRVHDYRAKQGLIWSGIVAPEDAAWALDRETLWNRAEAAEKRVNSTVAREYQLGLPHELPREAQIAAAQAFARHVSGRYGIACDIALHEPNREGDARNVHAHILTTTRQVGSEGFGAKTRVLDAAKTGSVEIVGLREAWGAIANQALREHGEKQRVDHRSLEAQRGAAAEQAVLFEARGEHDKAARAADRAGYLDRAPEWHMGVAATAMERREQRRAERLEEPYRPVTEVGRVVAEVREARHGYLSVFRDLHRARHGVHEVAEVIRQRAAEVAKATQKRLEGLLAFGERLSARKRQEAETEARHRAEVEARRVQAERADRERHAAALLARAQGRPQDPARPDPQAVRDRATSGPERSEEAPVERPSRGFRERGPGF